MNQQVRLKGVLLSFSLVFLILTGCVVSTTDAPSNETQEIEGETHIYGEEDETSNEANNTFSSEEASISSQDEVLEDSGNSVEGSSAIIYEGEHTIYTGDQALLNAFAEERSDMLVETAGEVERILSDDLEGSRHQRFILRLADNHTVLIAHNIDLAPKVPLQEGDWVEVRGEYEWNPQGGVIHWTHHDPDGRHLDGWILYNGEYYE